MPELMTHTGTAKKKITTSRMMKKKTMSGKPLRQAKQRLIDTRKKTLKTTHRPTATPVEADPVNHNKSGAGDTLPHTVAHTLSGLSDEDISDENVTTKYRAGGEAEPCVFGPVIPVLHVLSQRYTTFTLTISPHDLRPFSCTVQLMCTIYSCAMLTDGWKGCTGRQHRSVGYTKFDLKIYKKKNRISLFSD